MDPMLHTIRIPDHCKSQQFAPNARTANIENTCALDRIVFALKVSFCVWALYASRNQLLCGMGKRANYFTYGFAVNDFTIIRSTAPWFKPLPGVVEVAPF
jgi:hypothetical protein